ncbi:hypothetical protein [Actinomadura sp. 9N407]|uniref:hypothetical protein n=1 Tax=Actinomadura sp. 9N407 TaxID=3375154 RepID=UPI0037AC6740
MTPASIAGKHLRDLGVPPGELNTYASRRGNHTIMMRGAFANPRLRNQLVPGTEGPWTLDLLNEDAITSIYDTAAGYRAAAVPAIILAGHGYGAGSSRDWAAKGPALLGVRAVIAASFERIHRSNLIGMGILPLQFRDGQTADTLGLHGQEAYTIHGLEPLNEGLIPNTVTVTADDRTFNVTARLDTPREADYYRHGGIMPFVLRALLADRKE